MNAKPYVIEVVLFEVNPEYTVEEVKTALTSLNDIVKLYDGFIDRITANNKEGKYIDLVYWDTMESAKKAAETIMKDQKSETIFKVIKSTSVDMYHFNVFNHFEE
ncbi:hypothetical protein [Aquimarina sp. RZ0]|uniref:hypothetical protein n=1 Tax=Aquimarina sp. RZ0 TaxID=2607730 RepID=UPI0011F0F34F|nr:hypothetical protein [Aquimarina sp. RZ0]KAA1245993.1 hypothetical protein F0000_09775 [Aquimarina sp. RZ0]